jgi:hypothetical protein
VQGRPKNCASIKRVFSSSNRSHPVQGPTQTPIQSELGTLSPEIKWPGRETNTHLYLVPKLRMCGVIPRSYTWLQSEVIKNRHKYKVKKEPKWQSSSKKEGEVLSRLKTDVTDKAEVTIFLLLQGKFLTERNFNSHVNPSEKNPMVYRCRTWKARMEMLTCHGPLPKKQLDYKLPGICDT